MRNDTRAFQVDQIVRQLSALPGGRAVDIVARKLPRFGPAEPGSSYQVLYRSYAIQQLPESFNVPDDSEEIVIRLRGALEPADAKDALVSELHSIFAADDDMREHWDVRTRFRNGGDSPPAYELTIFSHLPPASATALDFV